MFMSIVRRINETYDVISNINEEFKKDVILEATDVYDNVDFKDRVVGSSTPSKDNINVSLLQDVQTAAKSAGVKVDITTAVTGHDKGTRHESGNAVDIAIINGKAVSSSNREDADKFVKALVSMGYTKNVESGNEKAVLTFGFPGHDNHVHVSNKGNSTSTPKQSSAITTDTTTDSSSEISSTSDDDGSGAENFARQVGSELLKAYGIKEERIYSGFGHGTQSRYGSIVIPKENNSKIKSPVDGVVNGIIYNSSCDNQIVIEFDNDGETSYLEYCGISSPSVRKGQRINKGTTLGSTDSDVRVSQYNSSRDREYINTDKQKKVKEKSKKTKERDKDDDKSQGLDLSDKNEYSKLLIKGYREFKNSFKRKDPKKIKEDIDKIKKLL